MKKILSKKSWLVVLIIAISFWVGQGISLADTVLLEDDFNAENGGVPTLNYYGFTKWDVTDGSVDLIGNGYYDFYPGNGLYVDLDGSTGDAGILATKDTFPIAIQANTTYILEFDMGRSQPGYSNDVTFTVGSYSHQLTIPGDQLLTHFSFAFESGTPETARITFSNAGGDNIGAILDNVKLSQLQVPEPTTMLLLGLGLIGVAGIKRRFNG